MPNLNDCGAFIGFGADIKEARKALKMSRRVMAEEIGITPRYLANIENCGTLPSMPVFYDLVKLCKIPIDRYFFPEAEKDGNHVRNRAYMKLAICPEQYLPIIESAIDGAIKLD